MNKKIFSAFTAVVLVGILMLGSCKKDDTNEPLEPISLVTPDTSVVRPFPGDVVPIEIKFTTDRPINWIKGLYDIDTTNTTSYVATYPDTLFFTRLDTLDPRVNLYTYTGSYLVPDTSDAFDVVRFKISFEAGNTTFTVGQNFPAGKVSATKEFKLVVR